MGISLKDLTPEEREALMAEALKAEQDRNRKREDERRVYKELVNEKVEGLFPRLQEISELLAEAKREVYREFEAALEIKAELYDVPGDQNSHSFINKGATKRIVIGACQKDDYDDTVNEGIGKVKAFISSLARDEESTMLVRSILRLLARDQKGNLKASRVMQLRKMAEDSGNEMFLDGVRIIEQAYRPVQTKTYVRAEYKNEAGAWVAVPLGMTEA